MVVGKIITQNEFIIDMIEIHNNKYDYSLVEYINTKTKVKIICPIHGTFKQRPYSHRFGQGCSKCGYINVIKHRSSNTSLFIKKSKLIHNEYDYSLVEYINNYTKVKIICPVHGIFEQRPQDHLKGNGCKKCYNENQQGLYNLTTLNRDPYLANKNATLYIIKHDNLHKVGITTLSIFQRFTKSVQVISELNNITLLEAFTKEQEILEQYSQYKEKPKNWNKRYNGDTEFLNISNEQTNQIIIDYFSLGKPYQ